MSVPASHLYLGASWGPGTACFLFLGSQPFPFPSHTFRYYSQSPFPFYKVWRTHHIPLCSCGNRGRHLLCWAAQWSTPSTACTCLLECRLLSSPPACNCSTVVFLQMCPGVWLRGSIPRSRPGRSSSKCSFQNAMMTAPTVR